VGAQGGGLGHPKAGAAGVSAAQCKPKCMGRLCCCLSVGLLMVGGMWPAAASLVPGGCMVAEALE
jgi:hypothetical protein